MCVFWYQQAPPTQIEISLVESDEIYLDVLLLCSVEVHQRHT